MCDMVRTGEDEKALDDVLGMRIFRAMKTAASKFSKRTDCHRVGVLVPTDYVYVMSYVIPEANWANTGYRFADARAACEAIGYGAAKPMFGTMGKCAICGASFRVGNIWTHIPTGDMLHVGHECADKVELVMEAGERRALNRALATVKTNSKANKAKDASKTSVRAKYFAAFPGLEAALSVDHNLCRSLAKAIDARDFVTQEEIDAVLEIASAIGAVR